MAVVPRISNLYSKHNLHKKNMPYSEELYEFIIQSRKCHTLYANCEGLYSRRVVNVRDKDTLKNFIYYTLYFNGNNDWENEQDFMKHEHVENILSKMITTSKNFNFKDEIHFGVVWVYYFLYENKTQKSIPVFKIYKEKSGNEAVILDVSLILYPTWDNYLDNAEFPLCLLCVPQKGEYCFCDTENENKILALEYLCSKKLISNKGNPYRNSLLFANYIPFSQTAIHPWLNEIKNFASAKWEQIKQITIILWNKTKICGKGTLYNVLVFAYFVWTKLMELRCIFPDIWDSLLRDGLMLLNTRLEDGFWKNLLIPTFINCITSASASPASVLNESSNLSDYHYEAIHLIKLLNSPKKNWKEILRSFCIIFSKCENLLVALSLEVCLPPVLKFLLVILKFFSLKGNILESSNNNEEVLNNKELKCSTSLQSTNIISNSNSNQNQIENLEVVNYSDRTFKIMIEKTIDNMAVDKAVSNLSIMETTSAEEVQNRLLKITHKELNEKLSEIPPLLSTLSLEKNDEHVIILMQNTSLPYLTHGVSRLIGKEFVFKPEETFVHNVVDKSGKTVGTIFFLQEQLAVGLFSLEAIREKIRGKPFIFPKIT